MRLALGTEGLELVTGAGVCCCPIEDDVCDAFVNYGRVMDEECSVLSAARQGSALQRQWGADWMAV